MKLLNVLAKKSMVYKEIEKKIHEMENSNNELKVEFLEKEKENTLLGQEVINYQAEISRVYSGHKSMEEEINFLKYRNSTLSELHESVVQGNWPHDGSQMSYKCKYPFERIEILPRGEVYTCCSAYLKHNFYIGNIYENSVEDIWNSENACKLRYSVTMGNFEYCQRYCKWLHEEKGNKDANVSVDPLDINPIVCRENVEVYNSWEECRIESSPKFIALSCDESCNLSCPSCRSKTKALNMKDANLLYDKLEKTLTPLLSNCEHLHALGSGDLFASYALSKFYKTITSQKFPGLKLQIRTNAQLLTQKKWNEFSNLHDIPMILAISIDATDKETYEINRRGAKWETLCENLEFVKSWRMLPDSKIEKLCFDFVIQRNNYKQICEFVKFAERYNANMIEIQRIGNWGTYSNDEFSEIDVLDPKHKEYELAINELQKAMKSSRKVVIIQNVL